jgi:regulator of protease activity HflC (stomatin/prohibitin superfamily)
MSGFLVFLIILIALAAAAIWALRHAGVKRLFQRVTVFDGESGILLENGVFRRELPPGALWTGPNTTIVRASSAEQQMEVRGQEVLTADRLSIKITVLATYRIADLRQAFVGLGNKSAAADRWQFMAAIETRLHQAVRLAIRSLTASRSLEELLSQRTELDAELFALIDADAANTGVELIKAAVVDIMLTGPVKRAYAEIEQARLDGLAAVERARGEKAALRALANAARIIKDNPEVGRLRFLTGLEKAGASGAAIVVSAADLIPPSGETKPAGD